MCITPEYLKKFKVLLKEKFNQNISDKDAFANLTKLVNLMRLIDKPITKAQFEKLQARRNELGISIGAK